MAKVILKEYYYFKKFIDHVTLLTLEPLPEAYFVELEKAKIQVCGMPKKVKHSKKTDFSEFFPGVNIYSHHSILKNMKSLVDCNTLFR